MDIRQLRYALTLADELHFGRSAARHHIAAQPFGHAVKKLEIELGYRVFNRTSRRVAVTAQGELFLVEARNALTAFDRLGHERRRPAAADHLTIGTLGFGLANLWPEFSHALTDIAPQLTVAVEEISIDDQYDALQQGRVDAAIVTYIGPMDGLDFLPVLTTSRAVVVPRNSEYAAAEQLNVADVLDQPWVDVYREGTPLRGWIGDAFAGGGFGDRVLTPAAIPTAVAATQRLGIHALTGSRYFSNPDVCFVPFEGTPFQIAVAVRTNDHRPPALAAMQSAELMLALHNPNGGLIEG